MKMRKVVAMLMAIMMLCCIIPFSAAAESNSATIDFTDKANRVSYSTSQQVWAQNGITVTNDKGASTSNVGDYGGEGYPARFYKNSTLIVEYVGMTKIEFYCNTADYAAALQSAIGTNAAVDNKVVTVILKGDDSFSCVLSAGQVRVDSITVYGVGGGSAPVVPDEPDEPEVPDEPVTPDEPETPVEPAGSATIDFTALDNRVSCTTAQQVWKQNGIVFTNDKGASTSNVNEKYYNPVRCYKSSTVTIEYPGMTKIVIDSVTFADNDYAAGWADSFSANATATVVDGDVTIVLAEPADVFVWEKLTAQSRAYSITVYTTEGGETPEIPDTPDVPDQPDEPEADTELSIADAIALGLSKEHNAYTQGKYYVTGVITEVYNTQYGNMYITDEAGNTLLIYGTYSEDGSVRYDAMENAPVAGDTVTIYGAIGQYNGTAQIKNGWIIGVSGGDTPVDPEPDVPVDPPVSDEIETDYPFLFGMTQYNVSEEDVYFLAGGMDGYYMATTTDPDAALLVYLEAAPNGGYYFYTYDGNTKLYINMVVSGTHVNGAYEATASTVYRYDSYYGTLIADVDGSDYWFGTRNDKQYTTVGPVKVEYEGFYCEFYYFSDEGEDPDYPEDPDDLIDTTIPYLFGMVQYNVSEEDVYFLAGGMDGYYMATTTDENAAILVYLEKTNGGYYLYTYDECDNKLYINMVVSGTHVNGAYEITASTVYTYDWDLWTLVAEVNGELYAFGTRNDKQYTTMGPVKVEYEGFHADLYYYEEEVDCNHEFEITEIAPTCDTAGEIVYECVCCGYVEYEVIPATGEHTYSDAYDVECNTCGYVRDLPIYGGAIYVDNQSAQAGDTVTVKVQVDNNPGIVSAKVKVYFDSNLLEFVSAVEGNFSAGGYSWSDPTVAQEKGYVIINWCDATKPDSTADLLAVLTFKVKDDAPVGFAFLTVEFNCEEDIFNAADKTVYFDAVSGGVEIKESTEVMPGDVNGDGKLNNRDLGILQKYLNGIEVGMDDVAADLTGDGKINNRDLGMLQKLLNS